MKVNLLGVNLYKSKTLKRGFEFAANNGALFAAGTSLVLAPVARPISIFAAPKTDKENRKLACAKSIASSLVGFGLMMGVTLPITQNIKKIDKNPEKFLKSSTINALKENGKPLNLSKSYKFATQLFKLGIGTVAAIPKAIISCALIPPIMTLAFNKKSENKSNTPVFQQDKTPNKTNNISFTGRVQSDKIAKKISKIIDTEIMQKNVLKYKDSNYPMHIAAITDVAATGTFIAQTKHNKKIEESRKSTLCKNAAISTGLSIGASYVIDKALNKPTEKFIEKFKEINKTSPKLDKYVEGIKIAKPTIIMGLIYYCAIPFVSTFLAERFGDRKKT